MLFGAMLFRYDLGAEGKESKERVLARLFGQVTRSQRAKRTKYQLSCCCWTYLSTQLTLGTKVVLMQISKGRVLQLYYV